MKYLIYLVTFFSPLTLFSQEAVGLVEGYVVDQLSNEDLVFAEVMIYQGDKLITGTTTANDGYFSIQLPIGKYRIQATYVGYQPSIRIAINIVENEIKSIDFGLKLGVNLPLVVISAIGFDRSSVGCILRGWVTASSIQSDVHPAKEEDDHNDVKHEISIYPNPGTGLFYIDRKDKHLISSLTLFNINGQEIYRNVSPKQQLNIAHLQNGTYYLVYQTESNTLQSIPIVKIE